MGSRTIYVSGSKKPEAEETQSTAVVEPAEPVDDFDYKGTLDDMSKDPLFRYHYLGESDAIEDEGISDEEYEEIANFETDDEAKNAINALIAKKARAMSGKHYDGLLSEKRDEDERRNARIGLRKRFSELGEIDDSYKYDFGQGADDDIPLDDERFANTNIGKLTRYLVDKGYNVEQVNDMLKDELYSLASRINGHENKILRKSLADGGQTRTALVPQSRVPTKSVPDAADEDEYRVQIREALKNGDRDTLKLITERLKSNK